MSHIQSICPEIKDPDGVLFFMDNNHRKEMEGGFFM
jgi:hypothetical protein